MYYFTTRQPFQKQQFAVRSLVYALAEELKPQNVYVGTVTIGGYVSKGTFYDPDLIADKYWYLYQNRNEVEFVFAPT